MATDLETAAVVALLRRGTVARRPPLTVRLREAGSAVRLLEEEGWPSPGQGQLLAPAQPDPLEAARAQLTAWAQRGIQTISVLHPDYPANLQAVHDAPPLLFLAGRLVPADARAVAVVGSRRASPEGLRAGGEISTHLTALNYTVVSGLATGIDTATHRAALRSGRTLGVIGTGLNHSYPPENRDLQAEIAARGAVLSRFWPEARGTRGTFPARNVLMSGLSLATVIVEASATSGVRVQARAALRHGRPVFLRRPVLQQEWARELAGRPNVYVVGSPDEVTDGLEHLAGSETLSG